MAKGDAQRAAALCDLSRLQRAHHQPDRIGPRDLAGTAGPPLAQGRVTDKPNRGTTNIRHPRFDDWKGYRYLGAENRSLVPVNRFAEPTKLDDGSNGNAWLALNENEPMTFFAGLRTSWHGTRRTDEEPMARELFAFFTTKPNDVVVRSTPRRCR